jgi:hypothetical protein
LQAVLEVVANQRRAAVVAVAAVRVVCVRLVVYLSLLVRH